MNPPILATRPRKTAMKVTFCSVCEAAGALSEGFFSSWLALSASRSVRLRKGILKVYPAAEERVGWEKDEE